MRSTVETPVGDLVVKTQFNVSWVLAILTFGLVRRGWHTGKVTGWAIGTMRTRAVFDYAQRTGKTLPAGAWAISAQTWFLLAPRWGARQKHADYHRGAVEEAILFGRTMNDLGYTIRDGV